jgi:hypothetical protein
MDYDQLIEQSIRRAVSEAGQSDELANMLIRWFQEVSHGNESLDDLEATRRHCEILYEATSVAGHEQ